jgi:hypothetical protein
MGREFSAVVRRRSGALRLALAFVAMSAPALAEEPRRATLQYAVAPGIDGCFETVELEDAVAARLGYVPFVEQAPLAIRANVKRAAAGLSAELEVNDDGAKTARKLGSATRDCGELSRALALAISVAIDPLSLTRAPAPPLPTPEPEPAKPEPLPAEPAPLAAAPAPAAPPPAAAQPDRDEVAPRAELDSLWHVRGLVTGHAAFLTVPGATGGASIGVGLRRRAFWADAEFRYDFPGSATADGGGKVKASLMGGTLALCHGNLKLGLCALGLAARVAAAGSDVATPKEASSFLLGAGLRASLELPLFGPIFARLHADGLYVVTPYQLELRQRTVWESKPVSVLVGLGVGGSL